MRSMCRCLSSLALIMVLLGAPAVAADDEKKEANLTGLWSGSYAYPAEAMQADVAFTAVILHSGKEITGFIREANTFGASDDPWLHALVKGTVDPETGKITFTKTYDGTSDVKHDVTYSAKLSKDGAKFEEGAWNILDYAGTFRLTKDPKVTTGKLAGLWRGTNEPPEGSDIPTVKVSLVLLHKGDEIIGFAREPRIGADGTNPWFHATIKGSYDPKTGAVRLLKSYDGTARAVTEEEYLGKLEDGELKGKRKFGDMDAGRFVLKLEAER